MVIKIVGIILAVIVLLFICVLIIPTKLTISFYPDDKFKFNAKILGFTIFGKKPNKEKPDSNLKKNFKQKLGLDILDKDQLKNAIENGNFTDKVSRLAALVMLFLGQVKYLFSKIKVDKLYTMIICGGDGAEAAINYGIVCSAIYPLLGYLDANLNINQDMEDIEIYCDFENNNSIEFELILSIKTIYLLKAFFNALGEGTKMAKFMEARQNGNRK